MCIRDRVKIDKIINNNLIRTFDNNGKEVLVMGCGLGFQKKIGDTVDPVSYTHLK